MQNLKPNFVTTVKPGPPPKGKKTLVLILRQQSVEKPYRNMYNV